MISQERISGELIAASLITRDITVSQTKFPKTFINQIKLNIKLKSFTHKVEQDGHDVVFS